MNARRLERLETEAARHARPDAAGPGAAELAAMSDAELLAHFRACHRKWMATRTPEQREAERREREEFARLPYDELLRRYREALRGV
jgi:hypothetical protein